MLQSDGDGEGICICNASAQANTSQSIHKAGHTDYAYYGEQCIAHKSFMVLFLA